MRKKYLILLLLLLLFCEKAYPQISTGIDTWKDEIEIRFDNLIEFKSDKYSFVINADVKADILDDNFRGWTTSLKLNYESGKAWYQKSSNPLFNPADNLEDLYIKINQEEPIKILLYSGSYSCTNICALKRDNNLSISIVGTELFNNFLTANEITFRFYYDEFRDEVQLSGEKLKNLRKLLDKIVEIQDEYIQSY